MCLKTLIKENFKSQSQSANEADFFVSAVNVAHTSGPKLRQKITTDLAEVLNCDVASLMFLFDNSAANNDRAASVVFPDFGEAMLLEAAE